jgi:lipopolysaccharide export system protein LptC
MTDLYAPETAAGRRVRFDPTRPRGAADYVRAHRHSRRVKFLKYALPTIAAASVAGFILTMRFADITGAALVGLSGINIQEKRLVMDAPHMSGYDADRRPYEVKAIKALQSLDNPKMVTLDTIDAKFGTDGPDTVRVKARSGLFNGNQNSLLLQNGIAIDTSDGYQATLQDANIDISKGNLASQKPVEVHASDGSWLKANGVQILNRGAKVTFVNGVSVNFIPTDDDKAAANPDAAGKPAPTPDAGAATKPAGNDAAAKAAADTAADKPDAGPVAAKPDADKVAAKPDTDAARQAAAARLKSLTE